MIHDAGSSLWPRNNQSWKDHEKDIEPSGVSGTAVEASGDSGKETEASGDSGMAVEASGDSGQEAATEVIDPKTKARSGVLVKHLVNN